MQVQDVLFYYPITAPANTNVVIISVLLIIAGGLMIGAYFLIYLSLKIRQLNFVLYWMCKL